ncbi:hypothetical protein [Kaistia sp. UC242_56]|uniref:hypothetical protein n=1 Tax=Kaistia sp. UC242_56 TaxID=3374625 RepID=UPI0037BD8CE3
MNIAPLTALLSENITWYGDRGKRYKALSGWCRGAIWLFATSGVLSMSVGGATTATVLCAIAAGAAIGLDRTFSLTRNWLEFSVTEIELRAALAKMNFLLDAGAETAALLTVFDNAIKAIESETLGWKGDVSGGLEDLRSASRALRSE